MNHEGKEKQVMLCVIRMGGGSSVTVKQGKESQWEKSITFTTFYTLISSIKLIFN